MLETLTETQAAHLDDADECRHEVCSVCTSIRGLPMPSPAECVSPSDRLMIIRMEARIAALQAAAAELQTFVSGHLSAVYKLRQGDMIDDDGAIVRGPAAPEPA